MSSTILISLANHLWQSTLFAAAVGTFTLLLRTNGARIRYLLWLAASAKFLVPFALLAALGAHIPWSLGAVHATDPSFLAFAGQMAVSMRLFGGEGATAFVQVAHAGSRGDAVAIAFGVVWAIGTLVVTARWLTRWRVVQRTLRESTETGLRFVIPVRSSGAQFEPGILGVLRPVLVLPHGMEHRLNSAEMRAVLAHERCHVLWRDNLAAALHMLVEALFWFHPLVWWLGVRLISERERACDEQVLAEGHSREVYAEGILKVCEHYLQLALPCVSGVGGPNLRQRIERILQYRLVERLSGVRKFALSAAACAAVFVPVAVGALTGSHARAPGGGAGTGGPEIHNVSVRLRPAGGPISINFSYGGRFRYRSLRQLISDAYDVSDAQVVGREWSKEPGYYITADSPPISPLDPKFAVMIRHLLASHFGLIVKSERKPMDGFVLRVGSEGSKLTEAQARPERMGITSSFIEAQRVPLRVLVTILGHFLVAPVVDQTGLHGVYDYKVTWGRPLPASPVNPAVVAKALEEQLGLRLEARRVTVDVVDVVGLTSPINLPRE
ncbi:MAG: M56 family metallopeptidase [Steroidobacteraceae bacterium]